MRRIVTLLLAGSFAVACSSSNDGSAPSQPAVTPSPSPDSVGLAAGFYVNARSPGEPHYFFQVRGNGSTFSGTLAFEFQDGSTGEAQTFAGTAQGGIATFTFNNGHV